MQSLDPEKETKLKTALDAINKIFPPTKPPTFIPRLRRDSGRLQFPTVTCSDCGGDGGVDLAPGRAKHDDRHNECFPGDWEGCARCDGTGEITLEDE